MRNGWTPKRRARQRLLIHTWKPWEQSTGPKTAAGKACASRNAFKGGERRALGEVARALTQLYRGHTQRLHERLGQGLPPSQST